MMEQVAAIFGLVMLTAAPAAGDAGEPPRQFNHQVTGLFSADRERALRGAFEQIPGIRLVSLDLDNAEAILEYDPGKVFPNATPEQIVRQLDEKLKAASNQTFGARPPRSLPREKLERVEIPVAGLDCEACSLAAYEAVATLEGVEQATASFRAGRVTAWIDPRKIDRPRLEAALKQRGVDLALP